jgi:tetrahydromethanopterin S-methyltransferase subunit G
MAVMMNPRETWTDQRLDDLNKKVDDGFTKVDERFDRFEKSVTESFADTKAEMRGRFGRVEARMDAQFAEVSTRFDRMQQTLIGSAAVIVAALVGLIATQL